jgi:hypothetical protein
MLLLHSRIGISMKVAILVEDHPGEFTVEGKLFTSRGK